MSPKLFNILLIIVPAVLYFGYLDPMYNGTPGFVWTPGRSLSALKSENVQYINSINQIDLIKSEADKLNKNYQAIDPELIKKVNNLLPPSIDPIKLRNDIVSIAAKSGVAVTALTVLPDSKDQAYRVAFTIRARYSLFKKFMENYEKSTRMFILTDLKINRPEAATMSERDNLEDNADKLTIMIISKVYYKK